MRAKSAVDPEEARLRGFLDDKSARVRATALVALTTNNIMRPDEVESAMREIIDHGSAGANRALAQAIRYQPDDRLAWVLMELSRSSDRALLNEVAHAIAAQPHMKFMSALLRMLAVRNVRPAAREAFLAIGPAALDFLDGALSDPNVAIAIRRHIPRTLSKFNTAKAARILVDNLMSETDGMTRFKILRGLGRLQADNPRISLDRSALREVAHRTLERIIHVVTWRAAIEKDIAANATRRTRGSELLISLFEEKENNATERLFRLLHLLNPKEDFELIYAGLRSKDPKARSSSRELLEHLLEPELRDPVLALVDEVPDDQRLAVMHSYFRPPELGYAELLRTMLGDGSEAVRCIAAYHIGELGLDELRDPLAAVDSERTSYLREVVEHALSLLERPDEDRPFHAS
jgi:HEAT repeat protein